MEFIEFCLGVALLIAVSAFYQMATQPGMSAKHRAAVEESLKFAVYCDSHKEELPAKIRKRFDEMETFLKTLEGKGEK